MAHVSARAACSGSASTPPPRSALLVLAGGAAASGLPFYAILCLPILFAAGMSLFDTIDGAFMNFAYGWAFSQPVRKLFYNITVTGLSVVVALLIGSIELLGVLDVIDRRRPQPRRLPGGRPVRADLGARARGLALRADRGALERRRPPAVTRAPERPALRLRLGRGHPRDAARGGPPRVRARSARARRAVRRRRAGVGGPHRRARTRASSGRRSTATSSAWRRSASSATCTSATGRGSTRSHAAWIGST